jgi:hypothetical protein
VKEDTQRKINLRKPLPIHVRYFTCEVDTNSNVEIHTDIYLRDERMMKVIYGIPEETDPAAQGSPKSDTKEKTKSSMLRERSPTLTPKLRYTKRYTVEWPIS